jgi:hypothetical protein
MIQEVCALLPKEEDLLEKVQQRLESVNAHHHSVWRRITSTDLIAGSTFFILTNGIRHSLFSPTI